MSFRWEGQMVAEAPTLGPTSAGRLVIQVLLEAFQAGKPSVPSLEHCPKLLAEKAAFVCVCV